MPSTPLAWIGRTLRMFWRALDASRRLLLNLLFLALLVALVWALFQRGPQPLEDKTVLVLGLRGPVVEQRSGSWRDTVFGRLRGQAPREQVQLRDVLRALDAAATDPKIGQVLLMLDEFKGAGLPTLRELSAALARVRSAGKPVVAWGSGYDQRQYHLAAVADPVLLHPMGLVTIEGYGRWRNYYRDALDKVGVTVNLIRVGSYKSAGEPFTENAPSSAALEADAALAQSLWATYLADVEAARKLEAGSIVRLIDELPQRLAAVGGDAARLALETRLVDSLKSRDELRDLMIERGARDDTSKSFRQIGLDSYLARLEAERGGDAVGIVVAEGEISDGEAPPGRIGGLSTAALIRTAREDDRIKALVLRVDSPGGSAFGAELVRRELELTRKAGKPVVVSMGDLAASGGYWIATAADEIIADAATLTGSIGVFTLLPTAEKALDKIGVHTGGVTTTWLGGAFDPRRSLDPRLAALVQLSVDHTYAEFIGRVAEARRKTPQQIDAVAQGRVWTGAQALDNGLVDGLGSVRDAIDSAAARGKLGADFRVRYLDGRSGRLQQLVEWFGGNAFEALAGHAETWLPAIAAVPVDTLREMQHELLWLADLTRQRKPFALAVHCLCGEP